MSLRDIKYYTNLNNEPAYFNEPIERCERN
jgi:hypothetical protein